MGLGTCTETSKGSFLEHILNHTGLEQCGAPMSVKPEAFPLPGGPGDLHNEVSNGSLLEHIVNNTGSEQCWAPMFVKPEAMPFWRA